MLMWNKKTVPQPAGGGNLHVPTITCNGDVDDLHASQSAPFLGHPSPSMGWNSLQPNSFTNGFPESPLMSPKGRHISQSFLTAAASTTDIDGFPSTVSVIAELEDEVRGSPRDWKSMQQITFTNWVNTKLKGTQSNYTGPQVQNLSNDLSDGLILIRLLECVTKKKISGYDRSPKITAQKMVNLDIVFQFISTENIKLIGIGSHNIFNGNMKLIMGLIWTLIQRYQIKMTSTNVSTKAVMIHWLQSLLPTWRLTNLTTDWNDGRCLMALIAEVKPGIAPSVESLDPTKRRQNCATALRIAKNHLKIPQLIAPEDLSNPQIDQLSIITYLSYFCEPAKVRLLRWVKRFIPQMGITNFGSDWISGRAFGAIIDACFPGLFPAWRNMEKTKAEENLAQILPLAKKRLGVTSDFTAAELVKGNVEELKIMTFISLIRNSQLSALPEEIIASGPGLLKAVAGKQTSFEIDTTQAGPGKLFIDACYQNGEKVYFSIKERLSSILTITYTPSMCGVVNFDILWSDVPIPKSPFSVRVTDSQLVRIIDFERHPRTVQVNQEIELLLNTKPAGTGKVSAQLEQLGNGKLREQSIDAVVSKYPDGTAKLSYRPSKSGKAILKIFWNGEELTHLAIVYTVFDNQQYSIVEKPKEKIYRTFEHANFQVKSDHGLLNILQMTANFGDIQIPINFSTIQNNIGHASFISTLPGSYRIEVSSVGKLIDGSPFMVEVADPSQCKLEGILPKYLKLNSPHQLRVYTGTAGKGELAVTCPDRDVSQLFDSSIRTLPDKDSQAVVVTPRRVGNYLLGITFLDSHIPSSPFRVLVCDPSQCSVIGDVLGKRKWVVGKPIQFCVISRQPSHELKPQVKAKGPSAKYTAEVRTSDDHTYSVQFTPWEVGMHEVSVTYGGFDIPNSPFRLAIQSFDSNICSATGTGLQQALTGIPSQFIILAKQSGLIEDGTLQVSIQSIVKKIDCKVRIRDNNDGMYHVAYLTQLPGAYLINILAGGHHIPGSPFRLSALPGPDPDKCTMQGPALEPNAILTIGKPIEFSVDTSRGGTGYLTIKAVGPGGAQARVYIAKSERSGIHDVKLDPVRHGKYRVSIKWSGNHIPGSPFILKIFPGADASKCCAFGPGLEDGEVGQASTFVIETRDAGAGTLKVRLHGVKDAFKIELAPKDQTDVRTLEARYDPKKPGEYLITIKWSENNIPGSPFRVKIEGDVVNDDSGHGILATPIAAGLDTIMEESDDDIQVTSAPNLPQKKKRKKSKSKRPPAGVQMIPVLMMNPNDQNNEQMPKFVAGRGGQVPYQLAFAPFQVPVRQSKKKRSEKSQSVSFNSTVEVSPHPSSTALPQRHLMNTFSSLHQMGKKHRKSNSVPTPVPVDGTYSGQASVELNTVTKNSRAVRKGIMKRSTSDSEAGRRKI